MEMEVETVKYPIPDCFTLKALNVDVLKHPQVVAYEKKHGALPPAGMWQNGTVPEEVLKGSDDPTREALVVLAGYADEAHWLSYEYTRAMLEKDYPWADFSRVDWSEEITIRKYGKYLCVNEWVYYPGRKPYYLPNPSDVYVYNLRYVDPEEHDKIYELTQVSLSDYAKGEVAGVIDEVSEFVLKKDWGLIETWSPELSSDIYDSSVTVQDLLFIAGKRMIGTLKELGSTDRFCNHILFLLKLSINHIFLDWRDDSVDTSAYLDLLTAALYQTNSRAVAAKIIGSVKSWVAKLPFSNEDSSHTVDPEDPDETIVIYKSLYPKQEAILKEFITKKLKIKEHAYGDLLAYRSKSEYSDDRIE